MERGFGGSVVPTYQRYDGDNVQSDQKKTSLDRSKILRWRLATQAAFIRESEQRIIDNDSTDSDEETSSGSSQYVEEPEDELA